MRDYTIMPITATDDLHDCPAPGCDKRIPFDQMACRPHWFSLPAGLRSAIGRAWRSGDINATLELREEVVRTLAER